MTATPTDENRPLIQEREHAYDCTKPVPSSPSSMGSRNGLGDLRSLVFFGFGFYWAWLWIFQQTSALLSLGTPPPFGMGVLITLNTATSAVTMLIGALLSSRLARPLPHRVLVVAAGGFAIVATVLCISSESSSSIGWPAALTMVLTGSSQTCFNLLWGALYSKLDMQRGTVYLFGSVALGALLCVAVGSLRPEPAAVTTLCLPLLAIFSYIQSNRQLDEESADERDPDANKNSDNHPDERRSFPFGRFARLFIVIFVYAIAFSFVKNSLLFPVDESRETVYEFAHLGVVVGGAVMAVAAYRRPDGFDLSVVYRFILPIVSIGFLLISQLSNDLRSVALGCVFIGFTAFDVVT